MKKKLLLVTLLGLLSTNLLGVTTDGAVTEFVNKEISKDKMTWRSERMGNMFKWFEDYTGELNASIVPFGYDGFDMIQYQNESIKILIPFKMEEKKIIPMYHYDEIPKEFKDMSVTIVLNNGESYDYSDYLNWTKDSKAFKDMLSYNNHLETMGEVQASFDKGIFNDKLTDAIASKVEETFFGHAYYSFSYASGIIEQFENYVCERLTPHIEMIDYNQYILVYSGADYFYNAPTEVHISFPFELNNLNVERGTFEIKVYDEDIRVDLYQTKGGQVFQYSFSLEEMDEFIKKLEEDMGE